MESKPAREKSVSTQSQASAGAQRILLALDTPDLDSARALVERVHPHLGGVKVGKELFTSCGPKAVLIWRDLGLPVFLDLKFHDIPNTVASAVRAAGRLGVRWISLHVVGGRAMLEAAALERDRLPKPRPLLLGVTVLTSLGEAEFASEEVVERALLAQRSGLDGVIASPLEASRLRAACGPGFLLVTPGVRPTGTAVADQVRVATPAAAIRDGADRLVVGRPISQAADPRAAALAIAEEVTVALHEKPHDQASSSVSTRTPVTATELPDLLTKTRAFLEGHFVLSSGLHSDQYVQCARLLQHPEHARRVGGWLADRLRTHRPQVVLSTALGGVIIGQEVAGALGVRALFAERDATGTLKLRRGFWIEPQERVVLVDDVLTRGGSLAETAVLAKEHGAQVVGAGALIDRSGGDLALGMPFVALHEVRAKTYPREACPLCKSGVAIDKPGSRPS